MVSRSRGFSGGDVEEGALTHLILLRFCYILWDGLRRYGISLRSFSRTGLRW